MWGGMRAERGCGIMAQKARSQEWVSTRLDKQVEERAGSENKRRMSLEVRSISKSCCDTPVTEQASTFRFLEEL